MIIVPKNVSFLSEKAYVRSRAAIRNKGFNAKAGYFVVIREQQLFGLWVRV